MSHRTVQWLVVVVLAGTAFIIGDIIGWTSRSRTDAARASVAAVASSRSVVRGRAPGGTKAGVTRSVAALPTAQNRDLAAGANSVRALVGTKIEPSRQSTHASGRPPSTPAASAVAPTRAPSERRPSAPPVAPAPRIEFDNTEYDFSTVLIGDPVEHDFVFRNRGNAPLTINSVVTGCGCTAAFVEEEELPPGGEGRVKTTFRTEGRTGPQRKSIYVETNDPEQPRVTLRVVGEIKAQIEVSPRVIYAFNLPVGKAVTRTVTISGADGYAFQIATVSVVGSGIHASEPKRLAEDRYQIDVTLKRESARESSGGLVTLKTDSQRQRLVHVPVRTKLREKR